MSKVTVPHFGIHRDESGVAWLMQGRGSNNAVGLKESPPFVVEPISGIRHCNHHIPTQAPLPDRHHWDLMMQVFGDPLVQAMLPVPKDGDPGVYIIPQDGDELAMLVVLLSRMSSPIYPVTKMGWSMRPRELLGEMQQTNVQPLVMLATERQSTLVQEILPIARQLPRRLLVIAPDRFVAPLPAKKIDTDLYKRNLADLAGLPLEAIGAAIVRKYMRREWPINPKGSYDSHFPTRAARLSSR